jgi:hypothetical protein
MDTESVNRKRNTNEDSSAGPVAATSSARRDTVVREEEVFIDSKNHTAAKPKLTYFGRIKQLGNVSFYNREYREFLSRDAFGWFQLCLFYVVFYTALAGFFIICLLVFYSTIDPKKPTYINKVI